jgi:hypothetical protein
MTFINWEPVFSVTSGLEISLLFFFEISLLKNPIPAPLAGHQWLISIILDIWEAEIRGLWFKTSLGK